MKLFSLCKALVGHLELLTATLGVTLIRFYSIYLGNLLPMTNVVDNEKQTII